MKKGKFFQNEYWIYLLFLFLSLLLLCYNYIGRDVMYRGDDFFFHLPRIEGIAEGGRNGNFFQKINYSYLYGMGYATPLFYADLFLYPAALMRLIGLSVSSTLIIYLTIVNFAAFVIAYHSFKAYKNDVKSALLFAVLYGTSTYRLCDLIDRFALGELLALTFLPLAFLGVWKVVNDDSKKYYLLSIGMACLILSHSLSAFIFAFFIFLYLIPNIMNFIKEKTRILDMMKAVGLTVLLCLGFLLPMGEQLLDQSFYFQKNQVAYLSDGAESVGYYLEMAFKDNGFNNLGLLPFVLAVLMLVMFFKLSGLSKKLLILAVVFFIFATNLIPYELLDYSIFNSIQFPWRFFMMVTLLVYWVFADSADRLFTQAFLTKTLIYGSLALTSGLLIHHVIYPYYEDRFVSKQDVVNTAEGNYLGWGMEYLPSKLDSDDLQDSIGTIWNDNNIVFSNAKQEYGKITLDYQTMGVNEEQRIVFPFLYYKGYQARTDEGKVEVTNSDLVPGLCEVSLQGSGTLVIQYKATLVQILSAIVSVLSWLLLAVKLANDRYRFIKRKEKEPEDDLDEGTAEPEDI